MSGRGRPTFNKRLKEQKRKEKQQEKNARREERKLTSEPLPDEETLAEQARLALLEQAEETRRALEEAAAIGITAIDPIDEFASARRP